tara:strand:- start:168 stop:428 length:261 start_codon:yes stop_codon:yes gene_type:complete
MILEIILGTFVIFEGYVIWNLFRKTELLETWVEDFTQKIQTIQNELKDIDVSGAFESDDEVGETFKQIQEIVNQLETLKGEEVNAK